MAAPVAGEGRIAAGTLPGGRAATTWHIGPYDSLGESYRRLEAWVKAQGHEINGGPWEVYWTDPSRNPDPATWRTQLFQPVK